MFTDVLMVNPKTMGYTLTSNVCIDFFHAIAVLLDRVLENSLNSPIRIINLAYHG